MVRATLKEIVDRLSSKDFIQIQRSHVVAMSQIEKIEDNHVFISDHKLSIGGTYKQQFYSKINQLKQV